MNIKQLEQSHKQKKQLQIRVRGKTKNHSNNSSTASLELVQIKEEKYNRVAENVNHGKLN